MKKVIQRYFDMEKVIQRYLDMEPAGGILLIFAAGLAIVIANSVFQGHYESILNLSLAGMSLHHWINDGLMAIFFLQIGLEVKQELLEGELKERETAIFPAIAAIGGMVVPAGIYLLINTNDAIAIQGWAIPAATDIAFALGVISLLGTRVPSSLKMFLLALAIIDDLGVIVIIAVFYNSDVSTVALSVAFAMTALLIGMNFYRVTRTGAYLVVGAVLWIAMLKSGVHATLAGVMVGLVIPLKGKEGQKSPLNTLEYRLHPYVAFLILPIFAFANAGLSFDSMSLNDFMHPIPLGVACGLFLGKPLGVFIFSWCAVKTEIAKLPEGIQLKHIFAVSVLCGIGFTMSIFISSLAFGEVNAQYDVYARVGILIGSAFAALVGYLLLLFSLPKPLKS